MGGSPVWDGTLSPDSFNTSAAALVKRWKEIEVDDSLPEWTWKPCSKLGVPSEVCLSLSLFYVLFSSLPFPDSPCYFLNMLVCLAGRRVSSPGKSVPQLWNKPGG